MSSEVKPCDLPCPKCGSSDVHHRFYARGEWMKNEKYGISPSKYARGESSSYSATRDHLQHYCRCCSYIWETLPMKILQRRKSG